MAVLPVVGKLETLIEYLDGLTSRAPVAELKTRLVGLDVTVEDMADYVHFGEERYLRNLVHEGDWYHVLVICWRSGQRSPIHNHAESTCGLCVLAGVATETIIEPTPSGLIQLVSFHNRHTGDVAGSQDADIHQVSKRIERNDRNASSLIGATMCLCFAGAAVRVKEGIGLSFPVFNAVFSIRRHSHPPD